jgi:chemotaxis protein MotC
MLAVAATSAAVLLWSLRMTGGATQQVEIAEGSSIAIDARQVPDATGESGQFSALIQRLSIVQDTMIDGSNGAAAEQERLLKLAAQAIDDAPQGMWSQPHNVLALLPYLLNGGSARAVRRLLGRKVELGQHQKAVVAMLAFAERRKDAASLLEAIEPLDLPRMAGAAVAMAMGITLQSEPAKALPKFHIARLLAPGGLIDEGASRREILLLLAHKKQNEALVRASRYLWRFGRSIYAKQLTEYMASSILPDLVADEAVRPSLIRYFSELPAARRSGLLVDLARANVLSGRLEPIGFLDAQGKPSLGNPSQDLRMALYVAIAAMFSPGTAKLTDMLDALDNQALGAADQGLRDATRALATKLEEPPLAASEADQNVADSPVLRTAQDVIAQADEALMEMNR